MAKRILLFGDSNTWGFTPATEERYPEEIRWSGIVRKNLGSDYEVIEEGLNGRTTVFDDPVREYMNGIRYIGPCLLSHFPLDLVVVMLGTNDTKQRFGLNAWAIAEGINRIIDVIKRVSSETKGSGCPKILIAAPILIGPEMDRSPYAAEFEGLKTHELSKQLGPEYRRVAEAAGCAFFDASKYAAPSRKDSLHMEPEGHASLASAMEAKIRELLEPR